MRRGGWRSARVGREIGIAARSVRRRSQVFARRVGPGEELAVFID